MADVDRTRARSESSYGRAFDGVKFLSAGNSAGAFAMIAALHTIEGLPTVAIWLTKIAAIVFALGVLTSALAYRFIFSAIIDFDAFAYPIRPNAPDEKDHKSGVKAYGRGLYTALVAMNVFFVGFSCAFVALLVYVFE